jgi:hypothetical protein
MRYTKPQMLNNGNAGKMVQTNRPPKICCHADNKSMTPNSPAAYEADE